MWILGSITVLALTYLVYNYANVVRFQIMAQTAADEYAGNILQVQAEYFNRYEATLYAANVEEYRIRYLLDGMLLAINGSGGCNSSNTLSTTAKSCNRVYSDLSSQYNVAVQRYTQDILMLDSTAFSINSGNVQATISIAPREQINNSLNGATGTALNARYTVDAYQTRTRLLAVNHDATSTLVPGLGRSSSKSEDSENAYLFAPAEVDVITCITVPPLIRSFGPFTWPSYYAIGRAAATTAQVEHDFLQPGAVCDPSHTAYGCSSPYSAFQPPEDYTPTTVDSGNSNLNFYEVYYGGNPMTANPLVPAFQGTLQTDEFSAMMGWWTSIPIRPFGPAETAANVC